MEYSPVLRVAIIGPESCGKSTLALALAQRLAARNIATACVDEFARKYYAEREYCPTLGDIEAIARGQLLAEQAAMQQKPRVVLCDSTVLTCVIWAEVAFGRAGAVLPALNRPRDYDLTLLACPDIPWVFDPLRSHPGQRDRLLSLYRSALARHRINWTEVKGDGEIRIENAWMALWENYVKQLDVIKK